MCLLRGTNWISDIIQVHCRIETVNSGILEDLSVSNSRLLPKPVRSLGAPWFYITHFVVGWVNRLGCWAPVDTPWPCGNKWITEKMMNWETETVWSPQTTGRVRSSLLLGSKPPADRPVCCPHLLRVKIRLKIIGIESSPWNSCRIMFKSRALCWEFCSFSVSMNAMTSVARRLANVLERVTLIPIRTYESVYFRQFVWTYTCLYMVIRSTRNLISSEYVCIRITNIINLRILWNVTSSLSRFPRRTLLREVVSNI